MMGENKDEKMVSVKEFLGYLSYAGAGRFLEELMGDAESISNLVSMYSDDFSDRFSDAYPKLESSIKPVCHYIDKMQDQNEKKGKKFDGLIARVRKVVEGKD